MAQRPAWFRFSSIMRPPAPAPNPLPPAPIQTLMRPSFQIGPPLPSTQNQIQDPTPPPPPRSPTPIPSVGPIRPRFTNPVGPTPTEVPPRSPVVTTSPAPAPPHSTISPPTPAVAPPRSPILPPAHVVASPRYPVATPSRNVATPPRSPILPPASPLKAATQPNSKSPNANLSNFPESSPSVPNSPKPKTQSPILNYPISKTVSTNSPKVATANGKGTTPNLKPNYPSERTPAQSPKLKPLVCSPSPLTLPPAIINESEPTIEQKIVLVHETIDKPNKTCVPHNPLNGKREQVKHDKGASENKKLPTDSQGSGMRVITLAGENRGAVMQLSPSNRKNISMGNPHTLNKSNSKVGSSSDDQFSSQCSEEKKSRNGDKAKREMAMQSPPMSAYLNSNVQGVNNSILYNFTSSHNDPGIHLSLNRRANGNRYFKE